MPIFPAIVLFLHAEHVFYSFDLSLLVFSFLEFSFSCRLRFSSCQQKFSKTLQVPIIIF